MKSAWYVRMAAYVAAAGGLGMSPVEAQSLLSYSSDSVIVDYGAIPSTPSSKRSTGTSGSAAEAQKGFRFIPQGESVYVAPWDWDDDCFVPCRTASRSSGKARPAARTAKAPPAPPFVPPTPPKRTLAVTEVSINYNALNDPELQLWSGFPFDDSDGILLISPEDGQARALRPPRSPEARDTLLTVRSDAVQPLASPVSLLGPQTIVVAFAERSSQIPKGAYPDLDALLKRMQENSSLRATIRAYGEGSAANAAHKLSLARATVIRSYLVEGGVRNDRIAIEALGNKAKFGNGNTASIDIAG